MHKTGVIAVAIALTGLATLGLAGCSGSDVGTAESASVSDTADAQVQADETPAPLVAETPEGMTADDTDTQFAAYVRSQLLQNSGITGATDDQLIAAAAEACEQLRTPGVDSESIRLVEGEQPTASGYYMDTAAIIDGARRYYCPETIF